MNVYNLNSKNVYFIHGPKGERTISLVNFATRLRMRLEFRELDDPQDLVVDPESGKMFISDSGSNAKIWCQCYINSRACLMPSFYDFGIFTHERRRCFIKYVRFITDECHELQI